MTKKTQNELAKIIQDMIKRGECEIIKREGKITYKIRPTDSGHKSGNSARIESINKSIETGILLGEQRRAYRKRDQLPDPDKSPKADVNRRDTKLVVRLEQSDLDMFNEVAQASGLTKKETIREMIRLYREHLDLDTSS